jgi:hypothetical protein
VDNAHAIEFVALGTKDILKLDDLEVMANGNKQTNKAHAFTSRGFVDNYSRRPLNDLLPWSTKIHQYCKVSSNRMVRRGESPISLFVFLSLCVLECSRLELLFHCWENPNK